MRVVCQHCHFGRKSMVRNKHFRWLNILFVPGFMLMSLWMEMMHVQPEANLYLSLKHCHQLSSHLQHPATHWVNWLEGECRWWHMEPRSSIKGGARFQLTIRVWNAVAVFITCLRSWCYMLTHSDTDIPHCSWTAPLFLVASTWEKQRQHLDCKTECHNNCDISQCFLTS